MPPQVHGHPRLCLAAAAVAWTLGIAPGSGLHAASAVPGVSTTALGPTPVAAARADALLRRCRPIDLHSDGLWQLRSGRAQAFCGPHSTLQASLSRLQASHFDAQVLAVWTRPGHEHGPTAARAALDQFDATIRACPDLRPASAASLAAGPPASRGEGPAGRGALPDDRRVRGVLAIEGAEAIGETAEGLRPWHARGLLYVSPTWNHSNAFGDAATDVGRHGGLSAEGRRLVAIAGEIGVLMDISHVADSTAADVLRLSRRPVIASHSNARTVRDHARNVTDAQIRAVAGSGGVVGLNAHCPFVVRKGRACDVAAWVRHAEHVRKVGGDGVLALGSDFDGDIRAPQGYAHAGELPHLVAALLQRGWSEAVVCGLLGDNVRRVAATLGLPAARPMQPEKPAAGR